MFFLRNTLLRGWRNISKPYFRITKLTRYGFFSVSKELEIKKEKQHQTFIKSKNFCVKSNLDGIFLCKSVESKSVSNKSYKLWKHNHLTFSGDSFSIAEWSIHVLLNERLDPRVPLKPVESMRGNIAWKVNEENWL